MIPRTHVKKGEGRKRRVGSGKERREVASWLSGDRHPWYPDGGIRRDSIPH